MKLLFGKSRKEPEVKRQEEKIVLFVCVENAGRSQIAESFFRKYAPRLFYYKCRNQTSWRNQSHGYTSNERSWH
jgi:protein-tyrosine-phosphatase